MYIHLYSGETPPKAHFFSSNPLTSEFRKPELPTHAMGFRTRCRQCSVRLDDAHVPAAAQSIVPLFRHVDGFLLRVERAKALQDPRPPQSHLQAEAPQPASRASCSRGPCPASTISATTSPLYIRSFLLLYRLLRIYAYIYIYQSHVVPAAFKTPSCTGTGIALQGELPRRRGTD